MSEELWLHWYFHVIMIVVMFLQHKAYVFTKRDKEEIEKHVCYNINPMGEVIPAHHNYQI